ADSALPSWETVSGADITGAALTKVDDTNVTLTLGGTPSTALLRSASITAGWTGTLSVARGGTGTAGTGQLDTNGNIVVAYSGVSNAVNYVEIQNNETGFPVSLNARGSDTNIDLQFVAKGTGSYSFRGTST